MLIFKFKCEDRDKLLFHEENLCSISCSIYNIFTLFFLLLSISKLVSTTLKIFFENAYDYLTVCHISFERPANCERIIILHAWNIFRLTNGSEMPVHKILFMLKKFSGGLNIFCLVSLFSWDFIFFVNKTWGY